MRRGVGIVSRAVGVIRRVAMRARGSERGSVAVLIAIMLTMMIGFASLGTEVVYLLLKQRQMQTAANAAALGGATALMTGRPLSYTTEVYAEAASAGFVNGTGGTTVTINHPPTTGNYTSSTIAVEVIIAQPQTLLLSKLFFTGTWTVSARAVATEGSNAPACMLALQTGNVNGVLMGSGAAVKLNSCGLVANSTSSAALDVAGANLTAQTVSVSGATTITGGGSITASGGIKTDQPAVTDPYAGTPLPTYSGCKYGALPNAGLSVSTSQTISANGTYCGGLLISGGATVTMSAGTYVINGGSFGVSGGAKVTGTGVTIFMTGSGTNYAYVTINNGSAATLTAPTTGTYAGLIMYGDPAAPSSNVNTLSGGTVINLTGALYFPSQELYFANGTSSAATCTQLVALTIDIQGGTTINDNCGSAGTSVIGVVPSGAVE